MTHASFLVPLVFTAVAAGWGVGANAQALRSETLVMPGPVPVQAEAVRDEIVRLLTGLAFIESNLKEGFCSCKTGLPIPKDHIFSGR